MKKVISESRSLITVLLAIWPHNSMHTLRLNSCQMLFAVTWYLLSHDSGLFLAMFRCIENIEQPLFHKHSPICCVLFEKKQKSFSKKKKSSWFKKLIYSISVFFQFSSFPIFSSPEMLSSQEKNLPIIIWKCLVKREIKHNAQSLRRLIRLEAEQY